MPGDQQDRLLESYRQDAQVIPLRVKPFSGGFAQSSLAGRQTLRFIPIKGTLGTRKASLRVDGIKKELLSNRPFEHRPGKANPNRMKPCDRSMTNR